MTGFGLRRAGVLVACLTLVTAGLIGSFAAPASGLIGFEAELRLAFGDPSATGATLGQDITLSDCASNFGEVTRDSPTTDFTLDGGGFTITQTCPTAGVFGQNGDFALTFQNVTITGGNQDNTTTCFGGAIRTSSPVTVINSTIRDNSAACAGGGISVGSALTVTNSTISGNTTAGEGGGIFQSNSSEALTVTNSTVSGNSTTEGNAGGGIRTFGTATLVYSTVVDNTSPDGANVSGYVDSSVSMFGSVVALPQGGGDNCAGPSLNSNGYNWDDDGTCNFLSTGDHSDAGDPQLGALAENGGPTATRLPLSGSGLIDAIPTDACQDDGATGITTDQRGLPRPAVDGCDIGAVEVQPPPPVPPVPPTPPVPPPPAPAPPQPAGTVQVSPRFTG